MKYCGTVTVLLSVILKTTFWNIPGCMLLSHNSHLKISTTSTILLFTIRYLNKFNIYQYIFGRGPNACLSGDVLFLVKSATNQMLVSCSIYKKSNAMQL